MKPHSFGFEEIRPQHIIVVDIETGKKTEGKYERHSEVFIHTEIMKARKDVNCVVHSHPPYATAFGASAPTAPSDQPRRQYLLRWTADFRLHHSVDPHPGTGCGSREKSWAIAVAF